WHDRAILPPGDCRSDAWFAYDLGKRLKALYKDSTLKRDAPLRNLTWDYDGRDLGIEGEARYREGAPGDQRVSPGRAAATAGGGRARQRRFEGPRMRDLLRNLPGTGDESCRGEGQPTP